jgi:ribulose-5-phosphate 4-epimerase/fuculose-1-phosphate aldolase
MTHASVYECDPEIRAVFHIHNLMMWERLKGKMPTTAENVEFGTPEMAYEIKRLFTDSETYVKERKIIVMGGHKEGIISFGTTMDEAGMMLLRAYTGKQRR